MITIIFNHRTIDPPTGFQLGKHYELRNDQITGRPMALNDNNEWIPMAACYNNSWIGLVGTLFFYVLEDFSVDCLTDDSRPMDWFNVSAGCEEYKYDGKLYYEISILGGISVNPDW